MIDVFINSARLALSKDVRKSASAIIDILRKQEQWKSSISQIQIRIPRSHAEHAYLIRDLTVEKLAAMGCFPKGVIVHFAMSSDELVANAFEHGCRRDEDKIALIVETSPSFVSISAINPKRYSCELDIWISEAKTRSLQVPPSRRGRGLLYVKRVADSLVQVGKNGVKAVFYAVPVELWVGTCDGLTMIALLNKCHGNPRAADRIYNAAIRYLSTDVILDFTVAEGDEHGSAGYTMAIDLHNVFSAFGKKAVAYMPDCRFCDISVRNGVVATSWKEVFSILGREGQEDRYLAAFAEARRR